MTTEHPKTAFITGANKGIGFEVARQLAKLGYAVFVGSRDINKGKHAAQQLCDEGFEATFIQLDVTDPLSIKQAAGTFSQKADHLDVLINNAGVLDDHGEDILKLNVELLNRTLTTNVTGPIMVIQDFLPFLQKGQAARIINVSSALGSLTTMRSYSPAYSISKAALNAVTRQFAGALPGMAVNSVSPGWVRTDMGGHNASLSVEEGASGIVWLATDAPGSETGKFWQHKREIDW